MMHLNYRDARPIYTQIVDNFRQQVLTGILQKGDRLPSVRELASQLAINPNTIQRAYRELETEGLIASVPGKGSFVCRIPEIQPEHSAWDSLEQAVRQLTDLGISKEMIITHLMQGGDKNA